ncbi:MAG: hypothetical protein K0S44_2988 [Bacteroidetes bacterium]|nr:hypothetical protein [Bacteroidota bacterium]
MRKIIIISLLLSSLRINAQELNCQVQVLSQQIAGSDKSAFEALKTAIFEFMNNRKWTNESFKLEERIDCSILINLTDRLGTDEYKGTFQVQSRRPIYKTSYNSVLLNYNDQDFQFKYTENQPLEFNDNQFNGNLTAVLGYYAYLIIGLDYDSYALNGGATYLQRALAISNTAQDAAEPGWKAFESNKNRYWLINNMLDASFIPLRECYYNYHRKGLDIMVDNKEAGRLAITESIENLKKIHGIKPLSFNMQVFFNAKSDEIINIFSGAFTDEKAKIVNTLNEIDPTNANKYAKITNTN